MNVSKSATDPISRISEAIQAELAPLLAKSDQLEESMADVRMMMSAEDRGWKLIGDYISGDRDAGLNLDDLHQIIEKTRPRVAASSLDKRAIDLHTGYVFGKGFHIEGTEEVSGRGAKRGEYTFFTRQVNQESVFSDGAHEELQKARFTDGNVVVLVDPSKKTARRVPLDEITGFVSNPDFNEEIWYWKRTWTTKNKTTGEDETTSRWYPTLRQEGVKAKSFGTGNERASVDQRLIAVDMRANRQVGWALGIPDALAGMHWVEAYGQVMRYGQIVSESLAKIIFKVVSKSKTGAANVGVKMGNAEFGGGAAVGEGQDIQLVNSSQRSFDYTAARPLAAMAASAWNISVIDLLSDSSAAGSSYGSANALTEGVRNAMAAMQKSWTQFYQDIFQAAGFSRPTVRWAPMVEPDLYRHTQAVTMAWNTGLYHPEEIRPALAHAVGVNTLKPKAPEGVLLPNNTESIQRSDIDTDGSEPGATPQAASPDQGRKNGSGGSDGALKHDLEDSE